MSAPVPPSADQPALGKNAPAQPAETVVEPPAKRRPWQRGPGGAGPDGGGGHAEVAKIRTVVAQVVWALCAVFALILAVAALLIAIDANSSNDLVKWVLARADNVDLGFFDLANPVKDWDQDKGEFEDVKTALFNYGIAAIVWLVLGRVLERVIKPGK